MTAKVPKRRIRTNALRNDKQTARKYREAVEEELHQLNWKEMDIDTLYTHFSTSLIAAGERILGTANHRKKPQLTNELYGML